MSTAGATSTGLRLEALSVPRGSRMVVRDVSLDIPTGEVTTLLGPNGAGKSTLVLAVAGVLRPASGRVVLGDDDLTRRRPERIRAAGVAVVPEGRRLLPELTVADNLRVATYSLSREDAESGTAYALELFPELKKRWEVPGRSLSGGEQQMVVLAQALVSRPAILLVDELSLGLAPVIVKRLVPTLASVAESGVGVLLIEQFAHVALAPRDLGLRARGRADPLPRDRRRAARQPGAAALRLSAARRADSRRRPVASRCWPRREEETMEEHTYGVTDVVGTSKDGIDQAIRNAITRANKTVRNLDWFEVGEIRGYIEEGSVSYTQVALRVGFRLEDPA